MRLKHRITPYLLFDDKAEEAALFYTTVFANSRIDTVVRYGEAGGEVHGGKPGTVMAGAFELDGQRFIALNAVAPGQACPSPSLQVSCKSQPEMDRLWEKLAAPDAAPHPHPCGWLTDRFGVSWQIVPHILHDLVNDPDSVKAQRAAHAMWQMNRLDIAALLRAFAGAPAA